MSDSQSRAEMREEDEAAEREEDRALSRGDFLDRQKKARKNLSNPREQIMSLLQENGSTAYSALLLLDAYAASLTTTLRDEIAMRILPQVRECVVAGAEVEAYSIADNMLEARMK